MQKSSNTFYAEINNRADKRAAQLKQAGYRFEELTDYRMAVFIKGEAGSKPQVIPMGVVLYAPPRVWADIVSRL